MLQLGTAKCCITPQKPVRMCGYATRKTVYDTVKEDIYLRVHTVFDGERYVSIVSADLLWWNSDYIKVIRKMLKETPSIRSQDIVFVASHNHSGPGTGESFIALLETVDPDYCSFLSQQVIAGIEKSYLDLEPVTVQKMQGKCAMNVFRRVQTEQGVEMRPNYAVSADTTLTVLAYYTESEQLKGAMVHYPCHANLSNRNELQPDYPGIAMRMLEQSFPESVCLFLQGCTADLRPNSVLGDQFVPCDYTGVQQFATSFFEHCHALLQTQGQALVGGVAVTQQCIDLPLVQDFTREEVETTTQDSALEIRQWAAKILEKELRPYETLEASCLSIAGQLILTFNAEVSQYYAAYARDCVAGALSVAYANGMIGYLSTKEQILQGGYEPKGSATYFALAGTYATEIEEKIHQLTKQLLMKTDEIV